MLTLLHAQHVTMIKIHVTVISLLGQLKNRKDIFGQSFRDLKSKPKTFYWTWHCKNWEQKNWVLEQSSLDVVWRCSGQESVSESVIDCWEQSINIQSPFWKVNKTLKPKAASIYAV